MFDFGFVFHEVPSSQSLWLQLWSSCQHRWDWESAPTLLAHSLEATFIELATLVLKHGKQFRKMQVSGRRNGLPRRYSFWGPITGAFGNLQCLVQDLAVPPSCLSSIAASNQEPFYIAVALSETSKTWENFIVSTDGFQIELGKDNKHLGNSLRKGPVQQRSMNMVLPWGWLPYFAVPGFVTLWAVASSGLFDSSSTKIAEPIRILNNKTTTNPSI